MMVDDTALHARTSELAPEGDPPHLAGTRRNLARMLPSMHAFVERAHEPEPMAPWNDDEHRWTLGSTSGSARDLVDIPTFFFSPFEHVANEVAPLLHDEGDVRRVSVHELSGRCVTTLVLEHTTLATALRTTSRFHDIEALVRGLDTALEWLGVEGRVTLASEAFRRGHDVTGGVYLGARASTPLSKGGLVLAGLGLAVERTFTGDGGAPSAVFVPALTLGVRRCVVSLPSDAGCVAFAIDLAGVLRLPTDGDSELRRARAGFSFAIGPAVLF